MSIPKGGGANDAKDRIWLPLILPLVAVGITALLIVAIGQTLLAFDGVLFEIGDQHIVTPVIVALGLAVVVLLGAAIIARIWAKDEE